MTDHKEPPREVHHVAGRDGAAVILLRWDVHSDGHIYAVNFEIVHPSIHLERNGKWVPNYPLGEELTDGHTEDPAKARPDVDGFLKWDGCMQFHVEDQHHDSVESLADFGAEMLEARRLAAEVMSRTGTWMP